MLSVTCCAGLCGVTCCAESRAVRSHVLRQSSQGAQYVLLLLVGFHTALCYAGLQFFRNHSSNTSSFVIILGLKKKCKKKKLLLVDF